MNNLTEETLIKAEIINIYWERINLFIDVQINPIKNFDTNVPLDFYALNGKRAAKAKFQAEKISDNI